MTKYIIDNFYYNHNVNFRIHLKYFFLKKSEYLKSHIEFWNKHHWLSKKKNILKLNNFSLFNYYQYSIMQTFIYLTILNKKYGSIKFYGYQMFYPYWTSLMLKGSLLKIKKNNFNTTLSVLNYVDGFYIKRYIFLFSSLLGYIVNQEWKDLVPFFKLLKKKFKAKQLNYGYRYNIYKNTSNLQNWVKINRYIFYRRYKFNKKPNKKYKRNVALWLWWWGRMFFRKFKRWKLWYRRYPFKRLRYRRHRYYIIFDLCWIF